MPFNVSDVAVWAKTGGSGISSLFISNPVNTAIVFGILICALVVYIFNEDDILQPRKKFFKLMFYTIILSMGVLFMHDETLCKAIKMQSVGGTVLGGDILANAMNANDPRGNNFVPVNALSTSGGMQMMQPTPYGVFGAGPRDTMTGGVLPANYAAGNMIGGSVPYTTSVNMQPPPTFGGDPANHAR